MLWMLFWVNSTEHRYALEMYEPSTGIERVKEISKVSEQRSARRKR